MSPPVVVTGLGHYLPPARSVRELLAAAGGPADGYEGWERVCMARDEDHPSTMGATALRAALEDAGVSPFHLRAVLFVGVTRDYLPSWSVATEIMRLCDAPASCVGVDMTNGCLGALTGIVASCGWLGDDDDGAVAIVAAERWSAAIDRSRAENRPLWAHADGAAAMIVQRAGAGFGVLGTAFESHAPLNGAILVKHGGTRSPVAPPGADPHAREMMPIPGRELFGVYRRVFERLIARAASFGRWDWLCVNQVSPKIVDMVREIAGLPADRVVITGNASGHVGAADCVLALEQLARDDVRGGVLMASSTPHAFGVAVLRR